MTDPRALVIVPTYNERQNLPLLDRPTDAAPERAAPRRRRSVARRHRRGGRRAGAAVRRPRRGHAPHRPARAGPFVSRWIQEGRRRECRRRLSDGRGLLPRPGPTPVADRGGLARRSRARLALHSGRRGRELAAPPGAAQPFRQRLHPDGHAPERARLHHRVPLLAARRARRAAARSHPVGRLLLSDRNAVHGGAQRRAGGRSADHLRRAPSGGIEAVARRHRRVDLDAMAPRSGAAGRDRDLVGFVLSCGFIQCQLLPLTNQRV